MNDAELERIERIVASLAEQMAEQNRAYALQREQDRAQAERRHAEREKAQAKLDKQLAELAEQVAEQNRAYALRLEEDRAKREKEHAKREEERVKREEEREKERATREAKYEKERAEREKERAEREKERAEREKEREAKYEEERKRARAEYERQRSESHAQWEKRHAELERIVKEASSMIGNHSRNVGSVTEYSFYTAFCEHPAIGDIHFDDVLPQIRLERSHTFPDIDILLLNDIYCAIVEIKYKCHPNDVQVFADRRPQFLSKIRKIFPRSHYIFAIGSEALLPKVVDQAHLSGLVVVEKCGSELKIDTSSMRLM